MNEKLLANANEVAEIMGICLKNVYVLMNREDFPVVRIGRRKLVSREGLKEWIRNQERGRGNIA